MRESSIKLIKHRHITHVIYVSADKLQFNEGWLTNFPLRMQMCVSDQTHLSPGLPSVAQQVLSFSKQLLQQEGSLLLGVGEAWLRHLQGKTQTHPGIIDTQLIKHLIIMDESSEQCIRHVTHSTVCSDESNRMYAPSHNNRFAQTSLVAVFREKYQLSCSFTASAGTRRIFHAAPSWQK